MEIEELKDFQLVGGTSLSLMIGHRISVDIDLFTDSEYGTINFLKIFKILNDKFQYISKEKWVNKSIGNSCFVGINKDETIKLDLFYTDKFVFPIHNVKNLRLSSLEEIAAMKLDVIGRGGRKKDFWDIHALLKHFTIEEMIGFYEERYPYSFSKQELRSQLVEFKNADLDPDPNCLLGNYWELIKLDIEDQLK